MRPLAIIALLLIISSNIHAQLNRDKLFFAEKIEKYRRMKSTGQVLTFTGGALMVIGIATAANASTTTVSNGYSTQTYSDGRLEQAALEILLGIPALGAGIPLWTVGAHSQHKYERKLQTVTLRPYTTPQYQGFSFCYRF